MEKTKHIVILAAGDFPSHPVPLQALHEADMVICCDSAYDEWKVQNANPKVQKPFIVIGDGDSLSEQDKQELADRCILVEEQDYNDLHKAMEYATGRFPNLKKVTILGATGRREDHTLGNISYLATFTREHPGLPIEMLTDYGRFTAFNGQREFGCFPRQQVSIFSMTPETPITATGLKWPLNQRCLPTWWEGTLNSALSDTFSIEGGIVIVFQTYEPKEI